MALLLLAAACLGPGASGAGQAVAGGQEEAAELLTCGVLALSSAVVVVVVLALWAKRLFRAPGLEEVEEAKVQGRARATVDGGQQDESSPEELESRLLQTFTRMEPELVKLVTLVRSHKARLALHHRGCAAPGCQEARESARAFNLAVYNIVED